MPKVGDKHFSYDAAGKKAAKKEAKKTGKKVEYNMGGKVETYQDQVKRKCS